MPTDLQDRAPDHQIARAADVPSVPRHVAIIMDGNGRWARQRGRPRTEGHLHGADATRRIVEEGARTGVKVMTLYSFSVENWRRPEHEVNFLMELFSLQVHKQLPDLVKNNIRLLHIGRRQGLPEPVLADLDRALRATETNTGMTLAMAWNYGGRTEIADAARSIAVDSAAGKLDPAAIDEETIAARLYTAGLPDPDLLIRTGGEMRISNFLLWQVSYAELWVTQTLWPDFTEEEFHQALRDYAARRRRFGGVEEAD